MLVGVGIAFALAAVALFALAGLGVDHVGELGVLAVLVLAAVGGGAVARVLVPRLPPLGRRPG